MSIRNITGELSIRASNYKQYNTIQDTKGVFFDTDGVLGDSYQLANTKDTPWHKLYFDASVDTSNYGNPTAGHTGEQISPYSASVYVLISY